MKSVFDDIHYYLFGIFTGLVLSGIVYLLLTESGILEWVYCHETLAGALLAFGAAVITVIYLHRQIVQAQEFENNRRQAKLGAEKAVLVHSLSFLIGHCRDVFAQILRMAEGEDFTPQLPHTPSQHIGTLKACIELAEESEKRKLKSIVCKLQLLIARHSDDIESYRPEDDISLIRADERAATDFYSSIESVVWIYVLTEELFGWAREEQEHSKPVEKMGSRGSRAMGLFNVRNYLVQPELPHVYLKENWQKLSAVMQSTVTTND